MLLILDSLGNSELLIILVAALIFFGPRKLPQLSRSIGKSLTDFRRASDDFKRTWAQEAALEGDEKRIIASPNIAPVDASILGATVQRQALDVAAQEAPREESANADPQLAAEPRASLPATPNGDENGDRAAEPLHKQDWL